MAFEEDDNNGVFANDKTSYSVTLKLTAATNGYYSFKLEANSISGNSDPTKNGYIFKGWVKENGNNVTFRISAIRKAFTYYALWEKIEE